MSSFTTLVNTDIDAAQKLTEFIATLLPTEQQQSFTTQSNQLIDNGRAHEVVMNLLEQSHLILALESDEGKVPMHCVNFANS